MKHSLLHYRRILPLATSRKARSQPIPCIPVVLKPPESFIARNIHELNAVIQEAAQEFLSLQFNDMTTARIRELLQNNHADTISEIEKATLEDSRLPT